MKKRANMLGKLLAPPVNPANGRLSSKELEKDGPGGNPLLERSSWTSEIDRMLFFRVEKKFYSILKPFLIFLNRLPEKIKGIDGEDIQTNHIPLNETTIKELRKIE